MNNITDRQQTTNALRPQQLAPRNVTVYKSVVPEKKPTEEIINRMFLIVADGNFLKIK